MSIEQASPRPRNVPATVGLGIDVLAVLVQIGTSALVVLLPVLAQRSGASTSEVGALFAGVGVVSLLLFLVGAALGLVGLLAAARPRAVAGAAFGIGVVGVVSTGAGLALPPLLGAALLG